MWIRRLKKVVGCAAKVLSCVLVKIASEAISAIFWLLGTSWGYTHTYIYMHRDRYVSYTCTEMCVCMCMDTHTHTEGMEFVCADGYVELHSGDFLS